MMKKLVLFIVLLFFAIVIFLFGISKRNPSIGPEDIQNSSEQVVNLPTKGETLPQLQFSGWIPWWDEKRALISLEKSKYRLSSILPVWYRIEKSGRINEIITSNRQEITEAAVTSGLLIIPTIFNDFDNQRVSLLFDDETLQKEEAKKLVKTALLSKYHGWDLDWEEILRSDRKRFTSFVELLAEELHKNNLLLSVTVHAQTGKIDDWENSLGQDWLELKNYADFIRIMAYDFHHSGSEPGPVTPLDKLREVLDYAVSVLPREKIVLGLPTYGYDWDREGGESFQYVDILERIEEFNGHYRRDSESFASKGSYALDGVEHTLWFEDSESITQKISIARSFGIYQFCFWSLGGEDKEIWEIEL